MKKIPVVIISFLFFLAANCEEAEKNPEDLPAPALKSVYENDFLIGNIINPVYMTADYLDLLKIHYNTVTCENHMKPDFLAPAAKGGAYSFSKDGNRADEMVNTMLAGGIQVHGHTLVWHSQTPKWMTEGSKAEVEATMKTYIADVLAHFKGRVKSWDVVNEGMKDGLSGADSSGDWKKCLRTESGWYKALGADYIEMAFRTARAADPDAILYYNDYSMDSPAKSSAVRNMVKDINDRYMAEGNTRKLIEGVGMQAHYQSNYLNINSVRMSLEKFIAIGVIVDITELDIRIGDMVTGTRKDTAMSNISAATQAKQYGQLFKLFKEYSDHISRVTMWGMDDENSWLSRGNPCLFDGNLKPKKAFYAAANPDLF